MIDLATATEHSARMVSIHRKLEELGYFVSRSRLQAIDQKSRELEGLRRRSASICDEIENVRRELETCPRPQVGQIFRRLKWADRREITARSIHAAGGQVVGQSDFILRLLALLGVKPS
jgi:hypothetical protein